MFGSLPNRLMIGIILTGLILAFPMAACKSNGDVPILESIAIIPNVISLDIGETAQCMAIVAYSDGSVADVTQGVSWSSSNATIISVSGLGLLTAHAGGTTVVSATYQDKVDSITVQVGAAPRILISMEIQPMQASIEVGQSLQYSAIVLYSDESTADVTTDVTWESLVPLVVKISPAGLAEGIGAGAATIRATFGDLSNSASIQVTTPAGAPPIPSWHSSYTFDQCASCHAPGGNPGAPDWPENHPPDPTCDLPGCHARA